MMIEIFTILICAYLYQYADELQDRSVNSHWTLRDWWVGVFSLEFLNKDVSWRLKWKNRDPKQGERFFGSSTFLVWLTDGEHLFQFIKQLIIAVMITLMAFLVITWWLGVVFMVGVYLQGFTKKFTDLR